MSFDLTFFRRVIKSSSSTVSTLWRKQRRFLDLCLCPSTILTEGKLIEILFSKISKILTRSIDLEKYCQIGKFNSTSKKKTRYLAYLAICGQKSVKSIQVCFFQYFVAWKIAEIIWIVIWFDEKHYVNNHRSVRIPNFSPHFLFLVM